MQWLLQTLLLGCALLLAVWLQAPWAALAGIGLVGIALVTVEATPARARKAVEAAGLTAVWAGSILVWVSMALSAMSCDFLYAVPAWLVAAALWLAQRGMAGDAAEARWKTPVMAWLFCGGLMWLGGGYFQNQRGGFYAGLFATLALLILCRVWFRLGSRGAQVVNTVILLLVGLPAADFVLRFHSRPPLRPETCRLYYSYDAAKGDPEAFARWEEYYTQEFDRMGSEVFTAAPNSPLPLRLRPNAHGFMLNCPISINSQGFRGPEIPPVKGDTYRIVALGESTTFGMTLQPGDLPWPEVLEQIIRKRLKTRRPVEVINAGVPAYTVTDSLYRLPRDILPLKPDLLISYHGVNGFSMIDSTVLPPVGHPPPFYKERPLKLAAQAEHRLRMMLFAWRAGRRHVVAAPPSAQPLKTQYAAAYRQLIQCARTNGIRLALANFSMAVNAQSEQGVIDFYRGGGTRASYGLMRANPVHSLIVEQLAAENPEVCFVDTHPHLDGEHEEFIDLIHLTQEGRQQLAENMFAGIRTILVQDLSQP
jgi:lysophospholipase L1-like esterase